MRKLAVAPTGVEKFFGEDEIIVSKTDARGVITYANDVFQRVSGYREEELLGQPHNLIRHPAMPQSVFRLLWNTIQAGDEIFAYVLNQCKNGDHYWVFAHVTPTFDARGKITGYHSNRRLPGREAIRKVEPLYASLLAVERKHGGGEAGMRAAMAALTDTLAAMGVSYEEFVFSLQALEEAETCVR